MHIVKAPQDTRDYKYIKLENGLEALLISDAHTAKVDPLYFFLFNSKLPQSSAALAVRVGSLNDPEKHQGLAHFLEHLLFMGTEKYPEEAEYSSFLANHAGYSNAYTDAEVTNYYFDIYSGMFEEALDR